MLLIRLKNRTKDKEKETTETNVHNHYEDIKEEYYDPVYYEIIQNEIDDYLEIYDENKSGFEDKIVVDQAKNEYFKMK